MDNPLVECELIHLLKTYADSELREPENTLLEEAYNRFVEQVVDLSEHSLSSIDFLRHLKITEITLAKIKLNIQPALHKIQAFFIDAAIKYLNCEQELVMLRLKYPQMGRPNGKQYQSPLYWSRTPTDLMELLSALQAAGSIKKIDGTDAEMTLMVESFEKFFNCHIKNPARCRNAAINRKIRLTRFLDLLKGALTNISQR